MRRRVGFGFRRARIRRLSCKRAGRGLLPGGDRVSLGSETSESELRVVNGLNELKTFTAGTESWRAINSRESPASAKMGDGTGGCSLGENQSRKKRLFTLWRAVFEAGRGVSEINLTISFRTT